MKKKFNDLLCPKCGKPQFETRSGDVCINGHGGVIGVEKKTVREQTQIKAKQIGRIRRFYHNEQKGYCPVLKMRYYSSDMTVDHAHSANARNLGKPEEAGIIRGIIHRAANAIEGKITNSFIRTGLHKFDITLPDFLRNLADFIENPPLVHLNYLHPTEAPKSKKLTKTSINKLVKQFKIRYPNKKLPEVLIYKQKKTKRGKMKDKDKPLTAGLQTLFAEFNIEPRYKK